MSTSTVHRSRTLATATDIEAVWSQVDAFLDSDDKLACALHPEQRAALRHLVALPFEVDTVADACRRVAVILDVLANAEGLIEAAFDGAVEAEINAADRPA